VKPENTNEHFTAAQSGDTLAMEKLVCDNLRLVHSIVKRFLGRGTDVDDLFQIGCIGLIKAVYGFDIKHGVTFSTYAVPMIMGEIRRYLRDDGIIRVSRRLKEVSIKAKYLKSELEGSLGRNPTISELATTMNVPRNELAAALDATLPIESIYQPMGNDGNSMLMDKLTSDDDMSVKVTSRIVLERMLNEVKPIERRVIYYRYFEDKKQNEIADILGISQVQVSRIEKKALHKMREKLYPKSFGGV